MKRIVFQKEVFWKEKEYIKWIWDYIRLATTQNVRLLTEYLEITKFGWNGTGKIILS